MAGRTFRVHQLAFEHRSRGTVLGSIALAVLVVGLCVPRTFAFSFLLLPISFLIARRSVPDTQAHLARAGAGARQAVLLAAAAFFAWAALSALWSVAPTMSLGKALAGAVVSLGAAITIYAAFGMSDGDASRFGEGVCIGVAVAAALLFFEIMSGHLLFKTFVNAAGVAPGTLKPTMFFTWVGRRLATVAVDELNRQVVALAFIAPAGILAARVTVQPWARLIALGLTGIAAAAVMASGSETAKLALAVSAVTWALTVVSRKAAFALLAAGWLSATLLVVPALQAAHATGFDSSPTLAKVLESGSAAERFKILNAFVARIGEAPLIGHGTNAAYVIGPQEVDEARHGEDPSGGKAPLAQHPHNAYLQIWFDLGFVGASLFAVLGIAILGLLRRLADDEQPLAYATFAAAAAILAPSYGLWQFWYMAMFGVGAVALGLAVRASRGCRVPGG